MKGPGVCRYYGCSAQQSNQSAFCSKSHFEADKVQNAAGIFPIPKNGSLWTSIVGQMMHSWSPTDPTVPKKPNVVQICEIKPSHKLYSQYDKYKQTVIQDNPPVFGKGGAGNTQRRFHGTKRSCNIGSGSCVPCMKQGCAVCGISQNGFLLNFVGSRPVSATTTTTNWSRFGKGHYFTATSHKSHSYNDNSSDVDGYRCVLLCAVVLGKGFKMNHDDTTMTQPPAGYHSVIGEPKNKMSGSNLNFDEAVVYTDEAIIPLYLVMYQG